LIAFGGAKVEDICEELTKNGYNYLGKDFFYNGMTGKPLIGYIYSGSVSFFSWINRLSFKLILDKKFIFKK